MRLLPLIVLFLACSPTGEGAHPDKKRKAEPRNPLESQRFEAEPIDLAQAHFYAHEPEQQSARETLELDEFKVSISTAPGTVRTRIDAVIRNPSDRQKQARIRVPIPEGAAVAKAVLYVGDKPMRGAFLSSARAETVYKSIVARKRDPLLVVWGGPKWVDLNIFPIEGTQTRRFQLEWVEPRSTSQAGHRLPILAHEGKVVSKVSEALVNGESVVVQEGVIHLDRDESTLISAKRPGSAFGYVMAPGKGSAETAVVLVAETSTRMSTDDRAEQRRALESVLSRLPASTRVTLLSADWLTKTIVKGESPEKVKAALTSLDDIVSAGSLDITNTFTEAKQVAQSMGAKTLVFFGRGANEFRGANPYAPTTQMLRSEAMSLFFVAPKGTSSPLRAVAWNTGGDTLTGKQPALRLSVLGVAPEMPSVEGWRAMYSAEGEPVWLGRFVGANPKGTVSGSASELEALWARSRVGSIQQMSPLARRVLTPTTSILVLESSQAYKRWGIPEPPEEEEEELVESQVAMNNNTKVDPEVAKAAALQQAREAGVAALPAQGGADFSSGLDDRDVYGGLLGTEVGEMAGGWGYGVSGIGPGGGGTGWGTIGLGNYGTIGHGEGTGYGYGSSGSGGMRGRKAKPPQVRIGNVSSTGDLDKNIIRRYIRRKLPRIRHCYEKELLAKPKLSGTVVTQFQISPAGTVSGANASGMENSNVESCVAAAIKSIQFPKPKGGGLVNVRYPFTFMHASGMAPAANHPDSPLQLALAAFKTLDKSERVTELSKQLGVSFESAPMLAWWLVREKVQTSRTWVEGFMLAALLLNDVGDAWNAQRLLSEVVPSSAAIWEQMREMGFEAGAKRLESLR